MIYLLLLFNLLAPFSKIFAYTASNSTEGLGVETLMGGVGQARLGSNGALGSNPALLGWLPKQQEFTSTNSISYYRLKSDPGGTINVTPDIIPRFAANSEGFGRWGHSYGLIVSKMKINVDQESGGYRAIGSQETQAISLNYGLGYKISDQSALGMSVNVGRAQEDGTFSSVGESEGFESAYIIRSRQSFWNQGVSLGYARALETWAFGLSTKFTTAKFGSTARNEQSGYSEVTNTNTTQIDHEVGQIKILPDFKLGIQKKLEFIKIFFDLKWTPGYTDPDFKQYVESTMSGIFGMEGFFSETYKWYTGIGYYPPDHLSKADAGSLHFGISKKGQHSLNYAGLSWTRAIASAESELINLNFGTKFDY